jgi:hypothetical protein
VLDPYNGTAIPGVTVTFSDGGKKGTFNPPSAISDGNGNLSTSYTFSKTSGTVTITATSPEAATLTFAETALPGPAVKMIAYIGAQQTAQAGSILPKLLTAKVEDAYSNGIPGVTTTFTDESHAGTLNPNSAVVTNTSGLAAVSYQLPNAAGPYKVEVSAPPLKVLTFTEHATGDAPANLGLVSGNNQTAPTNTALSQPLVVEVTDAGGNPVSGVSVTFSAPSGTFAGAPATTGADGTASVAYTTGSSGGTVTVTAAVNAVQAQFTVNVD